MKKSTKITKLEQLSEIEGVSVTDLIEQGTYDSVCCGICTNPKCDYTTTVEPDCFDGYCEECNTQTVASALVLAGII